MNFLNGLIFIAAGFVILLAQTGLIDLVLPFIWPILMVLYGFYLILTSQRRVVAKHEHKKAMKHEAKMEKKISKEHQKEKRKLERELDDKNRIIETQKNISEE